MTSFEALGIALIQNHICIRDVLPRQEIATKFMENVQVQSKDFENSTAKTQSSAITKSRGGCCLICTSDYKFQNAYMTSSKYI